jgi:hypothetical protein
MLDPNLHPINVLPWLLDGVPSGFDWNFDPISAPFDRGAVVAEKRTFRGLLTIPGVGCPSPIGLFLDHCLPLKRIELGPLVLMMGEPKHRHHFPLPPIAAPENSGLHPGIGLPLHTACDLDSYKTPMDLPAWAVVHKFGPPPILPWLG